MPDRATAFSSTACLLSFLVLSPAFAQGSTLYVDRQIASASCTTYAPPSRSCSGGSERAYRTLSGAAAAAVAGDTVYVRGGTYSEQLSPARSGTASLPITFAAHPGENPTLSGISSPALWLIQRSNIVIDGLTVSNVGGWGRLEDAANNTIRSCTFTVATIGGTTGGLKLVRSTYNKILDNVFEDGNDNIVIQESDRNVVEGNAVSTGRHSLLSLRCGNQNVVRGNTFSNPDQKDLEIYDCEGTSDAPVKLDATKRNLVEGNVIADTPASSANYDYNGIQFGGQQGIVRRNVFRDDLGGGINIQYYSDESLYNNRNRIYHNTFYSNRCFAIVGNSGDSSRYYDNRARNNILYKNTSCSGAATQTLVSNPSLVILSDNAILTTSPDFVDEAGGDFHLAVGSPMIDGAAFLTTTTAAGSGTQISVADASYFYDGYGIPGELGDEIQLQGQTAVARVLAVDLAANRLTLDRSLSWTAGTGVSLRYAGSKPDLGAYESASNEMPVELTVTKAGPGTGTVTSSPAGISCGSDCSEPYASGTVVTLTATAAAGSSFAGWSGACTGTASCQLTMSAARSVTATFNLNPNTLTVAKAGTGSGTVASSPAGISCGTDCSEPYASGTVVTLTATAATGSSFAGWSGACTGTASCQVTMSAARSVTATFNLNPNTLTVAKAGTGTGTVTSSPAGISCGSDCSEPYAPGTVVTLTATAASGSSFAGWGGACSGTAACQVTVSAAQSVTATFDLSALHTLTVSRTGLGSGTVSSSPAGIDCGAQCSASFASGTTVTLTALPEPGSDFVSWGGACSGSSLTCDVLVNAAGSVGADFDLAGEPVSWERLVSTQAQGSTLRRPSGSGWNAGAVSDRFIVSGDGYAEFTVAAPADYVMFGLSQGDTDAGYADIDFAFYTYPPTGKLMVYEKGQGRGTVSAYAPGDRLRVGVERGSVVYRKNGQLLYTSAALPTYPLLVDTSLYSTNAELTDAVLAGRLEGTRRGAEVDVIWRRLTRSTAEGSTLRRDAAVGWNAGASSAQELASGDGWAEYRVSDLGSYVMFGLAHADTDAGYGAIDHAIYTYPPAGRLFVYEAGQYRAPLGSYALNDVLRVAVENGTVTYSVNGALLYTSSTPPLYPLVADTSLYSANAVVAQARMGGDLREIVSWTNLRAVADAGGTLTRPVAGGWSAGAVSTRGIAAGDGGAEYVVADMASYVMFGLSNGDSNGSYTDIDYAIYTYPPTGQLMVYEKGVYRAGLGPYAPGDRLKVSVNGTVVCYFRNGALLFTSAAPPTFPLLLDVSLYAGRIEGARLTGNLSEVAASN